MIKVKDFWNHLCNGLGYRFFTGVASPHFNSLYKGMSSDILHYVPAVNERVALGMVSGAYTGGFKGGLLIDSRFIYDIKRLIKFNFDYKIPFLVISYGDNDSFLSTIDFKSLKDLDKINDLYESELVPVELKIREGILK